MRGSIQQSCGGWQLKSLSWWDDRGNREEGRCQRTALQQIHGTESALSVPSVILNVIFLSGTVDLWDQLGHNFLMCRNSLWGPNFFKKQGYKWAVKQSQILHLHNGKKGTHQSREVLLYSTSNFYPTLQLSQSGRCKQRQMWLFGKSTADRWIWILIMSEWVW